VLLVLSLFVAVYAQKAPEQTVVKAQKTSMTRDQELQLGKEAASHVEREMEAVPSTSAGRWTSPLQLSATFNQTAGSSPKDPARLAGWKRPRVQGGVNVAFSVDVRDRPHCRCARKTDHAGQRSQGHHRDDSAGDCRVDRGAGQLGRALFLYEPGQGTGLIMSTVSAILPLVVYRFFRWSTADCFRSAADFK
jgi:hypothetical protein